MLPVDQRHWHPDDPLGDCLAACVASIFEASLDDVPDFQGAATAKGAPASWYSELWEWFDREHPTLWPTYLFYPGRKRRFRRRPLGVHGGHWIAMVRSRVVPGEGSLHAVVMYRREVVHDPNHLSRAVVEPYWFAGEIFFEHVA